MLFLKIFDDREKEAEAIEDRYRSPIPAALRWRTWAANPEGVTGEPLMDFVNLQLFPKLKSLPITGHADRAKVIRDFFEDAYNYMKSGTLLRQVINKINEDIDFNKADDRHTLGDIYEQILRDLQSAGNAGEYYTPRAVTQFMADMVDPRLGETILDPACGTGGFLICSLEHIRKQDVKTAEAGSRLAAQRPRRREEAVAAHALRHEHDPARHRRADANPPRQHAAPPLARLRRQGLRRCCPDQSAVRRHGRGRHRNQLPRRLPHQGNRRPLSRSAHAPLEARRPRGIVLPDGTLFGEGVKTRIKEKLLDECNLHTIVRLPNGVFAPYTGIKTNLLFLTKGEKTKDIWYYEHPYPPGFKIVFQDEADPH